jgi:hypothetical protein
MIATGVLHTLVMFVFAAPHLWALVEAGWIGAAELKPLPMAAFWSLCCGFFMIFYGVALRDTEVVDGRVPSVSHGWLMIALTIFGGTAIPASGFWLALPQGIWLLRRNATLPE